MRITRHAVFARPPEKAGGSTRHQLLVLAEDAGRQIVDLWSAPVGARLRRAWRRTSGSEREAIAIFEQEAVDIWGEGPVYPVPSPAESVLDRLAAQGESATDARPLPRAAVPVTLAPERTADLADLIELAASPGNTLAFLPEGKERTLCAIDATGRASLLLAATASRPPRVIERGELAEADAMLPDRPWWDAAPALPSTTFDGYVDDPGIGAGEPIYWVLDILRYRGDDLTKRPLAERLALRDQALTELEEAGRLPERWRSVAHFDHPIDRASIADPAVSAAAAPLPRLAARDLGAPYGRDGAIVIAHLPMAVV